MRNNLIEKLKLFLPLLAIIGLLFLAACGGNDNATDANDDASKSKAGGEEHALDFSHFFPPTHFMEEEIQELAAELEEATDGRITITS